MFPKSLKKIFLYMAVSIFMELVIFNYSAVVSITAENRSLDVVRDGNTFYAFGMEGMPNYLYVGINRSNEDGELLAVTFTISIQDESNSGYYELEPVTLYTAIEKSKYLRLHSYGEVKALRIAVIVDPSESVQLTDVVYDARVPWFISLPRMLAIFAVLCMARCLRPGSGFYTREWKLWQRRLAVCALILSNIGLLFFLVRSNPAFLDPVWPYHQQYHQLAEALSEGRVSIDAGNDEILSALAKMDNAYDYTLRMQTVPNADRVWDICYYNGKFYVYFGIVPVLLFYLPYYLLFRGAFPTWLGVFIAACGVVGGTWYLVGKLRSRWFPESPFSWYLLLSVFMSNGLNLFPAILHADFYYLPIVMAVCFSLWGTGLVLSAANSWRNENGHVALKLAAGALCMALTAGCRPQFLVGSFLIFLILVPLVVERTGHEQKWRRLFGRMAAIILPYAIVAAGLMYYNFIRFGSVTDFGANYNLTTNDMTRRSLELGRLPDGIFMYLFQFPNLKLSFPFVEITAFYSDYLGNTVRDWTFGGAIWTHAILLGLLGIAIVKKNLQQKKLLGLTVASIGLALLVVVVDTEMAGILNRYYSDFLWLLMLPAVIILFQLLERWRTTPMANWLLGFILFTGVWTILFELGIAFRGSGIMNDNVHRYYIIKSFFQ